MRASRDNIYICVVFERLNPLLGKSPDNPIIPVSRNEGRRLKVSEYSVNFHPVNFQRECELELNRLTLIGHTFLKANFRKIKNRFISLYVTLL